MTAPHRPWPGVLVASSVALVLAIALNVHGPLRGVLALWFFLTCPGMALVGLLELNDLLAEVVLAVAMSIVIGMLLALGMLLTHTWSGDAAAAVLVVLSLVGAGFQLLARRSARSTSDAAGAGS